MTQDEELIERIDRMLLASPVEDDGTMIAIEPDDLREIRNRLEALARPVVGVQIPMALMQAVEDFINEPQRSPDIEPMEVRDYRHALYRVWSPLCQAILTANTAALAASPSPVVGDREALQEAHDAIDQALDDMGAQGHCVCPEAKDWLGSARTKAANALSTPVVGGFQDRVAPWMQECFGPVIAADKLERNDRFIEESLELVQSLGYSADRAHALVDYVFGRAIGEPAQEVGGVMVTLAALCLAADLDMHDAGEVELARINRPEIIAKIRAKQAAKPTGSALPIDPHTTDRAGMMQEVE